MTGLRERSESEWRATLSTGRYRVLRQRTTEVPYTGAYWDCQQPGLYKCAACGWPLFDSNEKFDAGNGWPSFRAPKTTECLEVAPDHSFGQRRMEVHCAGCASYLGRVAKSDESLSGLCYAINSAALLLEHAEARSGDEEPEPGWAF